MTRKAYNNDTNKHNIFEDVAIRAYEYYVAVETLKVSDGTFASEQHIRAANERLNVAQNYLKELRS